LVPAGSFFKFVGGAPCVAGPLYQGILQHLGPLSIGAVASGIAEGALIELVELANTGRKQQHAAGPMRDSEMFQGELGRVEAELSAARAFLEVQIRSLWDHVLAGTFAAEPRVLQHAIQAGSWVTATCVRAADTCFALGGGASVYESSPLQRRLRDLHVAAQHAIVQQRQYVGVGKLLLDSAVARSKPEKSNV
jgi:alkylation response protein AidB-like acyl-CoA dehydrogenase